MARKSVRQRSLFGGYEAPPRDPRGRPRVEWSKEVAENVALLAAQSRTQEQIAGAVGLSVKTLTRIYADELSSGAELIREAVFKRQVEKALDGNTAAAKFVEAALKTGDAKTISKRFGDSDAPAAATRSRSVGKKEALQIAAETAGLGSDWGDDLLGGIKPN